MSATEKVTTELYEALLHLRYPGIAQAAPQDMEDTILGRENRVFLLSWLLTQSPVVPSDEFAANTDEAKLVKWYTNMGICVNADALLGKVPMQDQISTLGNLLMFMKNVLIEDQSYSYKGPPVMDILKKHMGETINIIPPTCSLTSKLNYNEAVQYLKTRRRSVSERSSMNEFPAALHKAQSTSELQIFSTHESENSASSQDVDQEKVVETFLEAFESVPNWPNLKSDESTPALWKSMNSHVEKIHSNMTQLKETLRSKEEVSNFAISDVLTNREGPLDEIIEDIVIRLEEVNHLHKEE